MKPGYFSRRSFLRTAGLSPALLPLLDAGRASAAPPAKRMVIFCWTGGHRKGDFWPVLGPTKSETDWRLPMAGEGPAAAPVNFPTLEPAVKAFRNDMLLLASLDLNAFVDSQKKNHTVKTPSGGGGHDAMPTILTGRCLTQYNDGYVMYAGGPSLDQVVGKAVAQKYNLPFPALVLGTRTGSGNQSTLSYRARDDNDGITPENSPSRLFKTLFAGRNLSGMELDRTLAARKSVLDYLGADLTRYGERFGATDKAKIAAHLESIRDLERQLTIKPSAASCATPATPMASFTGADRTPDLTKAQLDLLTVALTCDLTRVATFLFTSSGGDDVTYPWLGQEFIGPSNDGPGGYPIRHHHEIAHAEFHGAEWGRRHSIVHRWYWEQVAYFVGRLKATPEGNGSMLDNTVVVVLNMMGRNHEVRGLPWVLIGSCGGYFKTGGRLLRFGNYAKPDPKWPFFWGSGDQSDADLGPSLARNGVPHNGILTALSNAMDVPVESFGEPEYGTELPGVRG